MGTQIRRLTKVVPVIVAASLLAFSGSVGTAGAIQPTLYFVYSMNCTFSIQDDQGRAVSSVPPGVYQVDVRTPLAFGTVPIYGLPAGDFTACKGMPQFQLNGPGVNISTTMTAGCQSDVLFQETLQPNSTYTAVDLNQPTVARASFSTSASGTPATPTATYGATSSHGETQSSIFATGQKAVAGTALATISADGTPTLMLGGKPLTNVAHGRYRFTINDASTTAGLVLLGPNTTKPVNVTGVAFKGKKSVVVLLKKGRWTYYTALKNLHTFVVS